MSLGHLKGQVWVTSILSYSAKVLAEFLAIYRLTRSSAKYTDLQYPAIAGVELGQGIGQQG